MRIIMYIVQYVAFSLSRFHDYSIIYRRYTDVVYELLVAFCKRE